MKRFFGKKQVLLSTLVVALGLAVYLNYYFASGVPSTDTVGKDDGTLGDAQFVGSQVDDGDLEKSYFEQARANRTAAREKALEIVQEMMSDVKADDEVIETAVQQASALAVSVEQESNIENLIKAKGFTDCVAYIDGKQCSVVVQSDELTASQVAQITEIVTAQSKISAQNITISAINS